MNDLKTLKEKQINDYISLILLNEDSIDVDNMKNDLGTILGEIPGIDLEYKTEQLIMEDGKKSIRKEKLESVNIYYTYDDNGILKFGTLTYLTD